VLRIDGMATDWKRAWSDTCRRARELDDVAFDARVHCLDRARLGLGNAVDVLQGGDADIARHAVAVLDRVPVASRCDVDRDADLGELPRDASLRVRIDEERARLDRATLLVQAAQLDEAAALTSQVAATAEELGFRPLLAHALLVSARIDGMRSDPLEAVPELERAALLAAELGLDEAAAVAQADLAFRYAYDLRKPDEGERWLEHAEVSDARTGGLALGPAHLLDVRAAVALGRGDYPRARTLLEEAVQRSEGELEQGEYLGHLGIVSDILGDHDTAAELHRRARAVNEQRFGPEHPMVAYDWGNEGLALRQAGREDEAAPCFDRELTLLERADGPNHPEVAIALAHKVETLSRRGEHTEALAIADRICAINLRTRGEDHVAYAQALYPRADVLLALGRADEAAADLRKGIAIAEKALGPEHADLVLPLRALAQSLREDHPKEAIAALERGLAIFAASPTDPRLRTAMVTMLAELRG
jgi:eukaryotic-like serine/threonine-protein kinase